MSNAFHDFIRPGEESIYAELDESLRNHLAPAGILEETLFDEIRRATWRLRRCGLVEESLAAAGAEDLSKTQLAVDKARSQAHRLLHKCTAELRRLQTDRQYRNETFPVDTDLSDVGLADYHREKFTGMADIDALLSTPIRPPSSFCKTQTAA